MCLSTGVGSTPFLTSEAGKGREGRGALAEGIVWRDREGRFVLLALTDDGELRLRLLALIAQSDPRFVLHLGYQLITSTDADEE